MIRLNDFLNDHLTMANKLKANFSSPNCLIRTVGQAFEVYWA